MKKDFKLKIVVVLIVIIIIGFFFFIKPFFKFKQLERKILESGKRYYEVNSSLLPTGSKLSTVTFQTLYDKEFINNDLKKELNDNNCNVDAGFVKVKKNNNEYKYFYYLECGLFKTKVDHEGPVIKLKGKDEINVYMYDKYNDPGIESVYDNTDGNIAINKVKVDTSSIKMNKIGKYKVTYTIKDSFDNKTVKERVVNVVETLNHIVKKQTKNKKIYSGENNSNYLKLDEIVFKIVKENSDGSVNIVSKDALSAVNYNKVEDWLNNYFYNKLSDNAKKYIKKDSVWCNDNVQDIEKYKKCNSYTSKNPVGLLSILDYSNAKTEDYSSLNISSITYNLKDKNTVYKISTTGIYTDKSDTNIVVSPSVNIEKNTYISSGNGTISNPYIIKGNNKKLKSGEKISKARVGSYLEYSGYSFRVIGKEDDETTKIIMDDTINLENQEYFTEFDTNSKINFNEKNKQSIAYFLNNKANSYIKTKFLVNRQQQILNYKGNIKYNGEVSNKNFKSKVFLPSIYDLFSTNLKNDYWYINHSSKNNIVCYMYYDGNVFCNKNNNDKKGIRIVAYLDKNVTIKLGNGKEDNPYTLAR